jgi:hypothetical protein
MDKNNISNDDDVAITGAIEKINPDVEKLKWRGTSSSSEDNNEAESSSSDEDPFPQMPPRKKKTSDDLDEDYVPDELEVPKINFKRLNMIL